MDVPGIGENSEVGLLAVTCQSALLIKMMHHHLNILKPTPYSRSVACFCGSSDAGRSSGKAMTAREV